MDSLQALMMPVAEDEQMKALARSLRGRQTAADFFSASSIPNLQKMAQSEQQYIQEVGQRQGVLREALERRKQDAKRHEEMMDYREEELDWRKADSQQKNALSLALATLAGSNQKPPAGYMWTEEGELRPIPGGPAEVKRMEQDAEIAEAAKKEEPMKQAAKKEEAKKEEVRKEAAEKESVKKETPEKESARPDSGDMREEMKKMLVTPFRFST